MFRPSDKRVEQIDFRDRELLSKYVEDDYIGEYNEDRQFTLVEYRCTASAALDRLELKGFTYEVAEKTFALGLKKEILRLEDFSSRYPNYLCDELQVLRSLTMQTWLREFWHIYREGLTAGFDDDPSSSDQQSRLLKYMLSSSRDFYGFPGFDYRNVVRLIVDGVPPQEEIIYDLSDLVEGGWIDGTDNLVAFTEDLMNEDFLLAHRVIVLTEGETDKRILERSLNLLYPHLSEYFHFFEFTGRKVGGGAGELANLVRAFAAADVRHRIIALFDNDTAAKASLSRLDLDSLPCNIAVRHYPNIDLARNYPTVVQAAWCGWM